VPGRSNETRVRSAKMKTQTRAFSRILQFVAYHERRWGDAEGNLWLHPWPLPLGPGVSNSSCSVGRM